MQKLNKWNKIMRIGLFFLAEVLSEKTKWDSTLKQWAIAPIFNSTGDSGELFSSKIILQGGLYNKGK